MTDKKIVSLQAVPKQAKPVEEEKKYKVSDEAIKDLSELLEKVNKETPYEVSEEAIFALTSALHAALDGVIHDVGCFVHHKEAKDITGCQLLFGGCEQTRTNPYKFLTLMRHAVNNLEDMVVYPPSEEFYD